MHWSRRPGNSASASTDSATRPGGTPGGRRGDARGRRGDAGGTPGGRRGAPGDAGGRQGDAEGAPGGARGAPGDAGGRRAFRRSPRIPADTEAFRGTLGEHRGAQWDTVGYHGGIMAHSRTLRGRQGTSMGRWGFGLIHETPGISGEVKPVPPLRSLQSVCGCGDVPAHRWPCPMQGTLQELPTTPSVLARR